MKPTAAKVSAWTEEACTFVLWNVAWGLLVVFHELLVVHGVIP